MTRTLSIALLAACGFALMHNTAFAQPHGNIAQSVPNLNATGRAELSKPADELRIDVGVVTQHEQAAEAVRQNARQMNELVAALKQAGLPESEYETGRYQIHPVYTQRPTRQQEEWAPRIAGYRVTNVIHIKSPQIDHAGKFIDAATRAGANSVDNIRFTLADARKHRAEAIATATRNAINDARALAEAAGLRLLRIVSINLDEAPVTPMRHDMMLGRVAMEAAEDPTPIRPGDVTVRATVNVVYEIAPRE